MVQQVEPDYVHRVGPKQSTLKTAYVQGQFAGFKASGLNTVNRVIIASATNYGAYNPNLAGDKMQQPAPTGFGIWLAGLVVYILSAIHVDLVS